MPCARRYKDIVAVGVDLVFDIQMWYPCQNQSGQHNYENCRSYYPVVPGIRWAPSSCCPNLGLDWCTMRRVEASSFACCCAGNVLVVLHIQWTALLSPSFSASLCLSLAGYRVRDRCRHRHHRTRFMQAAHPWDHAGRRGRQGRMAVRVDQLLAGVAVRGRDFQQRRSWSEHTRSCVRARQRPSDGRQRLPFRPMRTLDESCKGLPFV